MKKSMLDLNEQGLNVALYWENPDIRKYVNIVPTSAITGEGIPDLLQLLVKLTQVSPLASLSLHLLGHLCWPVSLIDSNNSGSCRTL